MPGAASKCFRGRARVNEPPVFRPGVPEVVAAIESLYADEVRPQGRILLKRLAEQAAAQRGGCYATVSHPGLADDLPRIDANRLRKVCERCRQINIVEEESGEYCALLVGRAARFVDACANGDDYPAEMWEAAAAHFASPCCEDMRLPGGRYACAQALQAVQLPFLAGYSLGRLCHIVQLAISRRHILGYLSGQVVPYGRSEAVVKQQCAKQQQAAVLGPRAVPALPLATVEQVQDGLRQLLAGNSDEPDVVIPLPNVKRLFRSRFALDLSETALGHSRLCELLQDSKFHRVCQVSLQGNGYVVMRAAQQFSDLAHLEGDMSRRSSIDEEAMQEPTSPEMWPAYDNIKPDCAVKPIVKVPETPEAWPAYCRRVSAGPVDTVAEAIKAALNATVAPSCSPPCFEAPTERDIMCRANSETTASSRERSPSHSATPRDDLSSTEETSTPGMPMTPEWPEEWEAAEDEDTYICSAVKNTFIHFSTPASSPGQSRTRARSVPRDMGSSLDAWEVASASMFARGR